MYFEPLKKLVFEILKFCKIFNFTKINTEAHTIIPIKENIHSDVLMVADKFL